jgi:GNAT superfamily N-acetyltransferase
MMAAGGPQKADSGVLSVVPLSVDDFSALRYLHVTALRNQTAEVLSDAEIAAFVRLVQSPAYTDLMMREEVYGGWLHGELVGTVGWQSSADSSSTARIGSIFVRHPRLGIGRHLIDAAEARAQRCGFVQFSVCVTANAVPFFERMGYRSVSRGVRSLSPDCSLPVTFLKKVPTRPRHSGSSSLM